MRSVYNINYKDEKYDFEENWLGEPKNYTKRLKIDQPELIKNKIEGDVIIANDESRYVLYDGKWRKMIAK